MSDPKTKPTQESVEAFLNGLENDEQRRDSQTLIEMMRRITAAEPEMWGAGMVGFGKYHYKYATGREGDYFQVGFAPRKKELTLYIMPGLYEFDPLLEKLGKHKNGKSCLYIKRLADVDMAVLETLVSESVSRLRNMYGTA